MEFLVAAGLDQGDWVFARCVCSHLASGFVATWNLPITAGGTDEATSERPPEFPGRPDAGGSKSGSPTSETDSGGSHVRRGTLAQHVKVHRQRHTGHRRKCHRDGVPNGTRTVPGGLCEQHERQDRGGTGADGATHSACSGGTASKTVRKRLAPPPCLRQCASSHHPSRKTRSTQWTHKCSAVLRASAISRVTS